jgi:hypothetical protein
MKKMIPTVEGEFICNLGSSAENIPKAAVERSKTTAKRLKGDKMPCKLACLLGKSICLAASYVHAEQTDNSRLRGVSFGLGLGTGYFEDADNAMAIETHLSYIFGANLLSLRTAAVGELLGEDVTDISLMYGRILSHGSKYASFSIGMGSVEVARDVFHGQESEWATGFAAGLHLLYRPISYFGVGINGFTNLNSKKSFTGFTIGVEISKFWESKLHGEN